MRKLLIILTLIFLLVSIAFLILPMGTIAFLPIGLVLVFAILTLIKSETEKKILPRWLIILSIVFILISAAKVIFIKDTVEADEDFELEQVESTEEAQQELEEIEELNDLENLNELETLDSIK